MVIYSQLRVSCGLSAIINSLQPENLKVSPYETLAHWLDANWLRLTNNNDPSNPLVNLCIAREHKWVAVLDYILLRKIRSSFLLSKGISPSALSQTDVSKEDINWKMVIPVLEKIFERLNKMQDDWPLWHYHGEIEDPAEIKKDEKLRDFALEMVQNIKVFYEIWESNITVGPDADWKQAVSLPDFPQFVTPQAVCNHLDHFKTNHELTALLNTLGWVPEPLPSSKNYNPNGIVLINRPAHWVCEDVRNRGVILDSLTVGTDTPRMGDTPYYYTPVGNLKLMKKALAELVKIFPQIEIEIEDEGLTEFPPLGPLPVVDNVEEKVAELLEKSEDYFKKGDIKKGLNEIRMALALFDKHKVETFEYLDLLLKFVKLCIENDKYLTAKENIEIAEALESKLHSKNIPQLILLRRLKAKILMFNEENEKAVDVLQIALEIASDHDGMEEVGYDISNSLGVLHARNKEYQKAIEFFKRAKDLAQKAYEKNVDEVAEDLTGPPKKYWPAIIQGLYNKILELEQIHYNLPKEAEQIAKEDESSDIKEKKEDSEINEKISKVE